MGYAHGLRRHELPFRNGCDVFADKVREYTNGNIDITVHPGGSLFKGGEIKRAIQTGQAPIGERFMSAHANEAPIAGVGQPAFCCHHL